MKQLIALRRVLDELDGETFKTLEGRITFQKRIYLAQALGLNLGYKFVWNQYGPYSSELAQDGDALRVSDDEVRKYAEALEFRSEIAGILGRVRGLAKTPEDVEITEPAWLELLTSLHFMTAVRDIELVGMTDEDAKPIVDDVLGFKPYFDEKLAWRALEAWKDALDQKVPATR